MPWPQTTITTDTGEQHSAIAPIIISASRATDIPAFYGEWFLRRLDAGYVRWINPWSGRPQFVSLRDARLFVFWSKNPDPFFPVLNELDRRGIPYYFHFTLNDYETEGLERGVPKLPERIATFKRLSDRIGRERIIWRFDPLLVTDTLTPAMLLHRIERVGSAVAAGADRLVISFITRYAKVLRNLEKAGIRLRAWDDASRQEMLLGIGALCGSWNLPVYTCAEETDAERFRIRHGKCIDEEHLRRVFGNDERLMTFLHKTGGMKDRGQRPLCHCIRSKDIGSYSTCGHACVYCYANASPGTAMENLLKTLNTADTIRTYSSSPSSAGAAGSSES